MSFKCFPRAPYGSLLKGSALGMKPVAVVAPKAKAKPAPKAKAKMKAKRK